VPPLIRFPKLGATMPLLLLRRLALVATLILLLAPAPPLSLSARADDAPKAAHEAAVLDRIFADWKARHDRVRSLHFTMDCRTTYKKGSLDFSSSAQARFDRDQEFQQFGVQLWIEGDDRLCIVTTPTFKVPQAKLTDTRRVVSRFVTVGTTTSMHSAGSWWETGVPAVRAFTPYGTVYRNPAGDRRMPGPVARPLLMTFRPQFASLSWQREQCRLVDENATVDSGHYVKFQRVIEPSRIIPFRREEACWVSPARDDVVVHWSIEVKDRTIDGSIKCKKDKTSGWIPSEWSVGTKGEEFSEYTVTNYAINEKIDPAIFSQEFPAGTPVVDQLDSPAARTIRHYVVQEDGSKRTITNEDFIRLAGLVDPPQKPAPAKPQGNDKTGIKEPRTQ
jgi:hypothetical protein